MSMPGAEGAALAALVDFCRDSAGPLTTAGVVQHFAGGAHDAVLLAALHRRAKARALSAESLEIQLAEGVKRYWMVRQKRAGASEAHGRGVDRALAGRGRTCAASAGWCRSGWRAGTDAISAAKGML